MTRAQIMRQARSSAVPPGITYDWSPVDQPHHRILSRDQGPSMETRLMTAWPEIVGPDFAARCVPEKLRRDGTLVVRADGPTADLLQHVEPQLRRRIADFAGYEAVKRLICRRLA